MTPKPPFDGVPKAIPAPFLPAIAIPRVLGVLSHFLPVPLKPSLLGAMDNPQTPPILEIAVEVPTAANILLRFLESARVTRTSLRQPLIPRLPIGIVANVVELFGLSIDVESLLTLKHLVHGRTSEIAAPFAPASATAAVLGALQFLPRLLQSKDLGLVRIVATRLRLVLPIDILVAIRVVILELLLSLNTRALSQLFPARLAPGRITNTRELFPVTRTFDIVLSLLLPTILKQLDPGTPKAIALLFAPAMAMDSALPVRAQPLLTLSKPRSFAPILRDRVLRDVLVPLFVDGVLSLLGALAGLVEGLLEGPRLLLLDELLLFLIVTPVLKEILTFLLAWHATTLLHLFGLSFLSGRTYMSIDLFVSSGLATLRITKRLGSTLRKPKPLPLAPATRIHRVLILLRLSPIALKL